MAKALVLGGATGLLGQALVMVLKNRGWQTETLGRTDGDLLDYDFLERAVRRADADVVFNGVAWTAVDDAEDKPNDALELNRAFPDALAHIIAKSDNTHLVHFSTDFVFSGQPPADYWRESDEPAPQSVYGRTKLEGERAVAKILPARSCIVRTAWLFGPGRRNFIDTILDNCQKRDLLSVVDDQMGSPTYTMDLANWSAALAEKRTFGLWHAVNSGHATWCDLASEAIQLVSGPCRVQPIHSREWPQKATRPRNSILANSKLANFLGARPRPWPQALRDYLYAYYLPQGEMR